MQNLIFNLLKDEAVIKKFKYPNNFTCSDENSEALLIATSFLSSKKTIVIVKNSLYSAQRLYDRVSSFLDTNDVYLFPTDESLRLDAIAESKLYQEFDKLIGGKTAVYISHRLSSTQFCNNVAMFMEGKMIEYGTHDSLMAQGGEYAKMFKIQSQYYIDEMEKSESDEQVAEVSHDFEEGGF